MQKGPSPTYLKFEKPEFQEEIIYPHGPTASGDQSQD
jgi:hypothetical protein